MNTRMVSVIFLVGWMGTACTGARYEARLHQLGEKAHAASWRDFRRCAPVEWADVSDHYEFAVRDWSQKRYRSAARHIEIAETQYAKAVEHVNRCPPGLRYPAEMAR